MDFILLPDDKIVVQNQKSGREGSPLLHRLFAQCNATMILFYFSCKNVDKVHDANDDVEKYFLPLSCSILLCIDATYNLFKNVLQKLLPKPT